MGNVKGSKREPYKWSPQKIEVLKQNLHLTNQELSDKLECSKSAVVAQKNIQQLYKEHRHKYNQ